MPATRYIALLAAVNVGRRQMKMARLREVVAALGHERVGTYIQTGNLFFTCATGPGPAALKRPLEQAIADEFGFDVDTVLLTVDRFAAILAAAPFPDRTLGATERELILFLRRPASPPALPVASRDGSFSIVGAEPDAWYVQISDAASWARTAGTEMKRIAGAVATTGRWRHTSAKILAAAQAGA